MTPLLVFCQFTPNDRQVDYLSAQPAVAATQALRETLVLHYTKFMQMTDGDTGACPLLQQYTQYLIKITDQIMAHSRIGEYAFKVARMAKVVLSGTPIGVYPIADWCEALHMSEDPFNETASCWLPYLHYQSKLWQRQVNQENETDPAVSEEITIPNARLVWPVLRITDAGELYLAIRVTGVQLWSNYLNIAPDSVLLSETLGTATPYSYLAEFSWEKYRLEDVTYSLSGLSFSASDGSYFSYLANAMYSLVTGSEKTVFDHACDYSLYYSMSNRHLQALIAFCTVLTERDNIETDRKTVMAMTLGGLVSTLDVDSTDLARLRSAFVGVSLANLNQVATEFFDARLASELVHMLTYAKPASSMDETEGDQKEKQDTKNEDGEEPNNEGPTDNDPGTQEIETASDPTLDPQSGEETDSEDAGKETEVAEGDESDPTVETPEGESDNQSTTTHTQSVVTLIEGIKGKTAEPITNATAVARNLLHQRIENIVERSTTIPSDVREALRGLLDHWLNILDLPTIHGMLRRVLAGTPELEQLEL